MPLADIARPLEIDDVVGQHHILGKNKPLRKIIDSSYIPNMIFYGPPGTGKTTVARIIAQNANMRLHKLNGTSASTADIKQIVSELDTIIGQNGVLLYLDEIQYLNKKQQQSLLEYMENGQITLIASTTENPYFYIYGAVLSRSTVFEFKPVSEKDLIPSIKRGIKLAKEQYNSKAAIDDEAVSLIAARCGGDVRKALNIIEVSILTSKNKKITKDDIDEIASRSATNYDRSGDTHFDLMSAFQKSIRGSDENAALHYLARLLESGDLLSPCRRLLVIASEDIGLAYPLALPVVKACVDSAQQLGLPEARIPLAQATILLATSPKSNSAYLAISKAMDDVQSGKGDGFPRALQNVHFDGEDGTNSKKPHYLYPHDFENNFVKQNYMPKDLEGTIYYEFGQNKNEQAAENYRNKILKEKNL